MKIWILTTLLAAVTLPTYAAGDDGQHPAFWHLGLVVEDLNLMDRFYGEVIGLQRVSDLLVEDASAASGADRAIVVERLDALMAVSGVRIEIRQYSDPDHAQFLELLHYPDHPAEKVERWTNRPYGLSHLGISVHVIEPVLQRMEQTGLGRLISGPQALAEFGGLRYAFIEDPEGNMVEVMERTALTETTGSH